MSLSVSSVGLVNGTTIEGLSLFLRLNQFNPSITTILSG
jgi:hypothetical protein